MARHTTRAEWTLVTAHLPGRPAEPIGILIRDTITDELYIKMLDDWSDLAGGEDSEFWPELQSDLIEKGRECGALALLSWLGSTMSHTVRIGPVQQITVEECSGTLAELFERYVQPGVRKPSQRGQSRIDLATLRFSAGPFANFPKLN